MSTKVFRWLLAVTLVAAWITNASGGPDRPTEFTNQGSVINTRHNLTQRSGSGADLLVGGPNAGGAAQMDTSRNNYGQVCVYCHTPHGANAAIGAPLWNRVTPAGPYATYDQLGTGVQQTYSQPGSASLPCLSCHDGQQAVDAIMNMPGSGKYSTDPNFGFLESWQPGGYSVGIHFKLTECMICHQPTGIGAIFPQATDFSAFVIGTDLRNDHPVGVTYPTTNGSGTDWNTPSGTKAVSAGTMKFFDEIGNGRLDKSEIRLYAATNGPSVECASCHDPHGVPSGAAGSVFQPSFLRKPIAGSNLCLTCHAK